MGVREEEDQKAKERSSAYQQMATLWAWKDFREFVSTIKEGAIKDLYQSTDEQATQAKFGRIRGILEAVDKIEKELDYVLNWGKE